MGPRWIQSVLDVLFPAHCRACDRWMAQEHGVLCRPCDDRLDRITGDICLRCGRPLAKYVEPAYGCAFCRRDRYAFQRSIAALRYDVASRPLIHRFKYGRERFLQRALAAFLVEAIERRGLQESIDVVTAVPLHWRRRWYRGYNQSDLLAQDVAHRLHLPRTDRLITRVRHTPAQALLTRAERRKNVNDAFACNRRVASNVRRVLLIDDVMSTGSTVSACAAAMRKVGIRDVVVAVVARS